MGQQQLLLLVLGVIIVGVAIVAGIGMFNASAEESTKDEITSQVMAIAANAQQWYKKPVAMGGGGGTFTGYVLPEKFSATPNCGTITVTGTTTAYTAGYFAVATDQTLTITANPNQTDYTWSVTGTVTPVNIQTVVVGG